MQKLIDLHYLIFDSNNLNGTGCEIAILHSELNKAAFEKYYVDPHLHSIKNKLIFFNLFKSKKNTKSELQKECLNEIFYHLDNLNITNIICADAEYFKTITGIQSAEKNLYTIVDSKCKKYKVIYCPSYKTIFYDPENIKHKIKLSLETFIDFYNGNTYYIPGSDIIKDYTVLSDPIEIEDFFNQVITNNIDLTSDIETFSLKHYDAGLYTITFCWDQHSGVSIPVDNIDKSKNIIVRKLLKDFFINNKNKIIWHNASFDLTVLIYQLFMDNHSDTVGLLQGLEVMLHNFEDTKLIAYLALNSTAKYSLSLKSLAYEYSGNYAIEEINDVTKLDLADVLKYNFIDGISTWYVYNKYYPIMIQDQQENVYVNIFKESLKDIIQMQLTGLPLDMDKTIKAFDKIKLIEQDALNNMLLSVLVQNYEFCLKQDWVLKKNNTLVKKKVTIHDCKLEFNPNSSIQVKELLYSQSFMDLPVLDLTTTKQPATGKKTLEKLIHYTNDPLQLDFINSLIRYKDVNKLVTSFFPAFMKAHKAFDGHHYLFGNFNLGGTKSGRLSSNKINLQNLPSTGTDYAKVVKECFVAPQGYLFIGADFNGLEDRISALQTKDPVKLSVFIDGFDGHCLNANAYYAEQMPDIQEQLSEINKEGNTFRITFDNGDIKYYNEFNPEFIKLKKETE
jgi:DNA polymerase-1